MTNAREFDSLTLFERESMLGLWGMRRALPQESDFTRRGRLRLRVSGNRRVALCGVRAL